VRKIASGAAVLAAALSVAGLALGAGNAVSYTLSARLTAGAEVPKQVIKVPGAKGAFTGTLTGRKLTWKLTFSGLSGAALQAHIHLGKAGVSGNVIVPLCAPCKSGVHGRKTVSAAIANDIRSNKTYVNVHTAKNTAGEIRGQLRAKA
jgi:hypothetical protein